MNHVSPYVIDLCILLVLIGVGYIATAIAYGMGYKEGKEDGAAELKRQGYIKPPF